jgi:hypothetical protein
MVGGAALETTTSVTSAHVEIGEVQYEGISQVMEIDQLRNDMEQ